MTPLDIESRRPVARKLAVIVDGAFVGAVVPLTAVAICGVCYLIARAALTIAPLWWWITLATAIGAVWGIVEALAQDRRHGWWR